MARTRLIKPGFFKNEQLAECPPLARLLFAGLWTLADRNGYLEDRPLRIKAEILPFDNCDCHALLTELAGVLLITRFTENGRRFIHIPTFTEHQRPHQKEPVIFDQSLEARRPPLTSIRADSTAVENIRQKPLVSGHSEQELQSDAKSGLSLAETVQPGQVDGKSENEALQINGKPGLYPPGMGGESRPNALNPFNLNPFNPSPSCAASAAEEAPQTPRKRGERKTFVQPTIEEVTAYCRERGNTVDPQLFVDHYTANGWRVGGKSPMKDWRASVRTWEKNGYQTRGGNVGQKSPDGLFAGFRDFLAKDETVTVEVIPNDSK